MRLLHIYIVFASIAMAITTPIVAQTAKNYYIVQDSVTGRCKVVDTKPTHHGVSAGIAYESVVLANAALAVAAKYEIPDCSSTPKG